MDDLVPAGWSELVAAARWWAASQLQAPKILIRGNQLDTVFPPAFGPRRAFPNNYSGVSVFVGQINKRKAMFECQILLENNHAAVGIHDSGVSLEAASLAVGVRPFQTHRHARVHACSPPPFGEAVHTGPEFTRLDAHFDLFTAMLELRRKAVNGTDASRRTKSQLVLRTGGPGGKVRNVKNLIVNADDLGWTEGVNRGITDAHRNGIVTSTSLLANGAAFQSGVELARSTPGLGVGVHLNLSDGPPVAPPETVTSLVNFSGEFAGGPESLLLRIARRDVTYGEVEQEWDAQVEKVCEAGIEPTHVDGHKHVHMLPGLFEIALRVAKRHGIGAIRVAHETSSLRAALSAGDEIRTSVVLKQGVQARGLKLLARDAGELAQHSGIAVADYFCGIAQTGELTKEGVARLLRALPEGTTELMCHPGYVDHDLRTTATRLQSSRQMELEILTNVDIRKLVASESIRLIDYGSVANAA